MMGAQPVSFRRVVPEPRIEMCDQTPLFPADLPVLFGDWAGKLPRLCRAEISAGDEPSASIHFAPEQSGADSVAMQGPPALLACATLFRYLTSRQEACFEDIPREVECCFKDTCGLPNVHVSLIGQSDGAYISRGAISPRLDVVEEFAVRLSADDLMQCCASQPARATGTPFRPNSIRLLQRTDAGWFGIGA